MSTEIQTTKFVSGNPFEYAGEHYEVLEIDHENKQYQCLDPFTEEVVAFGFDLEDKMNPVKD